MAWPRLLALSNRGLDRTALSERRRQVGEDQTWIVADCGRGSARDRSRRGRRRRVHNWIGRPHEEVVVPVGIAFKQLRQALLYGLSILKKGKRTAGGGTVELRERQREVARALVQ